MLLSKVPIKAVLYYLLFWSG